MANTQMFHNFLDVIGFNKETLHRYRAIISSLVSRQTNARRFQAWSQQIGVEKSFSERAKSYENSFHGYLVSGWAYSRRLRRR